MNDLSKVADDVDGGQMKKAIRIAEGLGIRSILHTDYRSTCAKLASFGLQHQQKENDDDIKS